MDSERVAADFNSLVNMDAAELEQWLESEESQRAGQKKNGATESVGHASGRRIVGILNTKIRSQ